MTPSLAHIWRHPIKSHGREQLNSVNLVAGCAMPNDRRWAITHDLTKFDPEYPAWASCVNFVRGAKVGELTAIECSFDDISETIKLQHPDFGEIIANPNEGEGAKAILAFSNAIIGNGILTPQKVVELKGRAFTDTDFPSISILNLASLRDLSARGQHKFTMERWRGNLWIDGLEPWAEFGLIGKCISIGGAILEIKEPIGRCSMTMNDPSVGAKDFDTLKLLRDNFGHQDFGVYAVVIEAGTITHGDRMEILS